MIQPTHVDGRETVPLMLFTLSTCAWCRKTKALLNELGVAYDYIDVDQIPAGENADITANLQAWNPRCSYPTLVVDGSLCIVGFKEAAIREVVGA